MALVGKNSLVNSGDVRDAGSIPESGRSPAVGHGNLLRDSCLENPMDRGAWWAQLMQLSTHMDSSCLFL